MRLLGLTIERATPELMVRGTDFEARSIVSASKELPTSSTDLQIVRQQRKAGMRGDEMVDRVVMSDPLGDWYLALPSKLEPKQVDSIMRASLAGNIWQFTQLVQRMMESWPMLKKCSHELRQAVSRVKYTVVPFVEKEGEDPTPTSVEKSDTVARAMRSFEIDRFSDEESFNGLVYDITDAAIVGLSISEIMWHQQADPAGTLEWLPRASAYVHPRLYAFSSDGKIGIGRSNTDDPMWQQVQAAKPVLNNPMKYIVAKFKSGSGSCLKNGLARSLCWWWVAVVYGRDFALSFAQKFGGPFLDIPYQSGIPKEDIDRLERLAKRAANLGYCVHPNTGEVKVTPAQSMGGENPQVVLMRMADEACQILLLGQTASTMGTPGMLGQENSRETVRREYVEGFAAWVAEILTEQFAWTVVKQNYHLSSAVTERPKVIADFTETEDPMQAATRWSTLLHTGQPFHADEFYDGVGARQPEEGDKVVVGQKIGTMGPDDFIVTGQPDYGYGFDDWGNPIPPPEMQQMGMVPGQTMGEFNGQQMMARDSQVRRALSRASLSELNALRAKAAACVKARETGHINGEHNEFIAALRQLQVNHSRR